MVTITFCTVPDNWTSPNEDNVIYVLQSTPLAIGLENTFWMCGELSSHHRFSSQQFAVTPRQLNSINACLWSVCLSFSRYASCEKNRLLRIWLFLNNTRKKMAHIPGWRPAVKITNTKSPTKVHHSMNAQRPDVLNLLIGKLSYNCTHSKNNFFALCMHACGNGLLTRLNKVWL